MNSQAYIDIAKRIRLKVPTVKTIDVFNNQYEEPSRHDPVTCPAVLVEWAPTEWSDLPMGIQEGVGGFRIHCVVNTLRHTRNIDLQTNTQAALNLLHLAFPKAVHAALQGFAPCGYGQLSRVQTQPDHRFSSIIVIVYEYRASVIDESAFEYEQYVEHPIEDFIVPGEIVP